MYVAAFINHDCSGTAQQVTSQGSVIETGGEAGFEMATDGIQLSVVCKLGYAYGRLKSSSFQEDTTASAIQSRWNKRQTVDITCHLQRGVRNCS